MTIAVRRRVVRAVTNATSASKIRVQPEFIRSVRVKARRRCLLIFRHAHADLVAPRPTKVARARRIIGRVQLSAHHLHVPIVVPTSDSVTHAPVRGLDRAELGAEKTSSGARNGRLVSREAARGDVGDQVIRAEDESEHGAPSKRLENHFRAIVSARVGELWRDARGGGRFRGRLFVSRAGRGGRAGRRGAVFVVVGSFNRTRSRLSPLGGLCLFCLFRLSLRFVRIRI